MTDNETKLIRWDAPPHRPNQRATDGPWGRYLVKRPESGERRFIALLNGKKTTISGKAPIDCMIVVERTIISNFPGYKPLLGKGAHA